MSLYIKNSEVDSMARELAEAEGVSVTQAVALALKDRLQKKPKKPSAKEMLRRVHAIQEKVKKLPRYNNQTAEEILGFNEFGAFD